MKTVGACILFSLITAIAAFGQEQLNGRVFIVVEQNPTFPGGDAAMMDFIRSHITYPADAAREGVAGTVYVEFVVSKTGSLHNIKVNRRVYPSLDSTALAVCKQMPKWIPGKLSGVNENVRVVIPVKFKLTDGLKKPWYDALVPKN